jgi:ABC-type sugar transport system ATPase subunit
MQPLLTVTGPSKTFPGLRALEGVDFAVNSGEIVALVGQNGLASRRS